jgi:cobalt-zinc-cadmium resistance protein CzcA
MLSRLVEFSLTQRLLVLVATLLLVGAGLRAWNNLPIDAFPDVSTTQVKLIIKAPGMTPEEVESRITVPIEQEMLGIPHQRILRSTSKYALADVTLDFEDGTDIYWARQQVGERLAGVMGNLPPAPAAASRRSPRRWARCSCSPSRARSRCRRSAPCSTGRSARAAHRARRGRRQQPGRRSTQLRDQPRPGRPGRPRPDLGSCRPPSRPTTATTAPAASARARRPCWCAPRRHPTLDDVRAIVLKASPGGIVRVGDVAEVRIGALTRYGAVTRNGEAEAVEGLVLGLRGANAGKVVEGVKRASPSWRRCCRRASRRALLRPQRAGRAAVHTVSKALVEAIVLVLVLLLAFLGNLRAALVVALMLPLAALATFIAMRAVGLSANLMSLGGLAIAIGMLVDAAVVVVENVETQLAEGGAAARQPLLHLVFRATREVAAPVASGILIIVIVFLPLLTLKAWRARCSARWR